VARTTGLTPSSWKKTTRRTSLLEVVRGGKVGWVGEVVWARGKEGGGLEERLLGRLEDRVQGEIELGQREGGPKRGVRV
jgi:hypothetical protein